jgi:dolichol-phosphate mannosyltransferase
MNIRPLVERTVASFRKLPEPAELIVVDDNSPDGTAAAAEEAARELDAAAVVRVIVRTEDRGLSQAVVAGFAAARGDVVAVMDADLSHPPELLGELLAPIREDRADISVASRRVKGGGVSNWPLKRRFISWGAGLLARPLVPIRDTTSGFFAARKSLLEMIELRPRGYKIGLEVFTRARAATPARMVEVPFVFTDRTAGESKLGGSVMFAYLVQLGELYRVRYPILVGYLMFSVVGGLGIGVDAVVYNLAYFYAGLEAVGLAAGGFLAQTASFLVAAVFNFALNRAWTFRDRAEEASLPKFILVCTGGYLLRSLVFAGIVALLSGAGEFAAGNAALAAGVFAASFWNFFGSRRWAFPRGGRALPASPEDLRESAWALALVLGLAVVRLAYIAFLPLAEDEAYYWQWSRHLDWGFHDHPPMIAYLIAAGTRFAGMNAFAIRLLPTLLATATVWLVYALAARAARSPRAGLWAAGAFAAAPMLASGSVLATPDAPFIFFWTAAIATAWRAVDTGRLAWWLAAGAALGLGMISKYPMAILAIALIVALPMSGAGRRAIGTVGPWAAAALAALICLPHLDWLRDQGFAPVGYQLGHGLDARSGMSGLDGLARFLALQIAVISPPLFALMAAALWRGAVAAARNMRHEDPGPALLAVPALLTFGLFAFTSLSSPGGANWLAPAYPTLFAIFGTMAVDWTGWRKGMAWASIGLAAAISLYAHVESAWPIVPYDKGPWLMVRDRTGLAQWVDALRSSKGAEGQAARILAKDYRIASTLAFYLPDRPDAWAPLERGSGAQYPVWYERSRAKGGGLAWYITNSDKDPALETLFETFERVDTYWETRLGVRILKEFHAFYGTLRASDP